MPIYKKVKDKLAKMLTSGDMVPMGLLELNKYFRHNDPISFKYNIEDGIIVAVSTNFRYGSIIAHGKNETELDEQIKDAIITSFNIPSSYAKEADVKKQDVAEKAYALA